jgi:hypothetical protein
MLDLKLLLSAIDRLIELFKIKERRFAFRYKEIYKPAFGELQEVHSDYIAMFESVGNSLTEMTKNEQNAQRGVEETLKAAAEYLRERRIAFDAVRGKLAYFGSTLEEANAGHLNPSERAFLSSLAAYFNSDEEDPHSEAVSASSYLIDRFENAITQIHQIVVGSSSTRNEERDTMGANQLLSKMSEACQTMIAKLRGRWLDVVDRYNKLRFELARETS